MISLSKQTVSLVRPGSNMFQHFSFLELLKTIIVKNKFLFKL